MRITFSALLLAILFGCKPSSDKDLQWTTYSGSPSGIRYSEAEEINPQNVGQLSVAWIYSSADHDSLTNRSQNQCTPSIINGVLYGVSPALKLFALDAATGSRKWVFDPASMDTYAKKDPFAYFKVSRGVVYWKDPSSDSARILYNVGQKTWCINASDGKPVAGFGKGGYIDLLEELDRDTSTFNPFIVATTPGIMYKDLLIMGSRVNESADAAPGHIRAYDIRTGNRKWIFHTIPYPGEKNYETWPDKNAYKKLGGANSWAGMSLDEKRGIVYVPTGSIGGDFYGGFRKGSNLYGNSLVALEASTGKYLWHYQVVHHDLWDRDLAANPNLVTIERNGKKIDAVAQITKHGYVFVFNRETGEPLFPIKEVPVAQNGLPGEEVWPTQPIPELPKPFARSDFKRADVWGVDELTKDSMLKAFDKIKFAEPFAPPSKEGSWIFPGFDGGGEWGGAAVDPGSGVMYVNASDLPWSLTMIDLPKKDNTDRSMKGIGKQVYQQKCMSCHGQDLKGSGPSYPSLVGVEGRLDEEQILGIINNGRNMMPAFRQLSATEKQGLIAFLMNKEMKEPSSNGAVNQGNSILDEVPYTMTGYNRFTDKNGYPGIKPPWGTLNAIDLNTGQTLWQVPLGEFEALKKMGIPATGTQVYGGPAVTKGGLVFVASTQDDKIRAFDKKTGKVLWEAALPAAGYATPSIYTVKGKQYVVIACGGGKLGSKSGDKYVAFALKK